jgi:hypothetical protein
MNLRPRFAAGAAVAVLFFTAGSLAAQDEAKGSGGESFGLDPYTKGDAAALAKAGYFAVGEFPFADGLTTAAIEKTLGDGVTMRWVETQHFKIGSSLPDYLVEDQADKTRLKPELDRLRKRLPDVPAKLPRKLDPWLRLHLTAQRCEELYAEYCRIFGFDKTAWPTGPGQTVGGEYRGEGPYLGMGDKYTVLLFAKESSYGRFRERFLNGGGAAASARHMFMRSGSMLYAAHIQGSNLDDDAVLHCALIYNLVFNLVDGTKHYSHSAPTWIAAGLGHALARRVSPKLNYFTDERAYSEDEKDQWNWPPRVHARVKNQIWPTAEKIFSLSDLGAMEYVEHMMAWSRMDYLMREKPDGLPAFLEGVKGQIATGRAPTPEEIAARHLESFQRAFDMDPAAFDAAWTAWVLATYPKK